MRPHRSARRNARGSGLATAAILAAVASAPALNAQSAPPPGVERSWEVAASLGVPFGSTHDDLELAMRAANWADPDGGREYPRYSGRELWWTASLRRRLGPTLDIAITGGLARLGSTSGHRDELPAGSEFYLSIEPTALAVASILSYRVNGWSVGAGPSLNRVRATNASADETEHESEAWKVGLLAETGGAYPRDSRVFFDVRFQYRWIPTLAAGPFRTHDFFAPAFTATLPATEIDLSHGFVSLGLGARF